MPYPGPQKGSGGILPNAAFQRNFVLQVLLVFVLGGIVENVKGLHAYGQCVQLGQAHANRQGRRMNESWRIGPFTIGARKFDIKYLFLDFSWVGEGSQLYDESDVNNSPCPYKLLPSKNNHSKLEPCVNDEVVELRTYAVKQNGKIMNGWLHFEFELKDITNHGRILAIYIQVRDEYYNAIGEFVSNPQEQCAPSTPDLAQPTEYQILPCSAVGYREAKTSNAVFMAARDIYKDEEILKGPYVSKVKISKGVHFTWRLSEYWCNRHLRFRPEATVFTQGNFNRGPNKQDFLVNKPLILRKAANYWFRPRWFGAADIKLPKTTLSCDEQVIDYEYGYVHTTLAPWLHKKGILGVLGNDYFAITQQFNDCSHKTCVQTIKGCQVNPHVMYNVENVSHMFGRNNCSKFAGRCTHHYEKTPSHNALQGCNVDEHNNAPEFDDVREMKFPNYTHIVKDLTRNRTNLCAVPCTLPTLANLKDIRSFNDTTGEFYFIESINYNAGGTRNTTKVEKLLIGRKYHASLCILWTMFLTPLGIFCARYFKETCMSVTCTGAHFWFWVHLATIFTASSVFISSLTGIWANLGNWGRNVDPAGIGHRVVGYFSVTFLFVMIILGGFRPLNLSTRIIIMKLHSIIGFLIYYLNFFAMYLSFFIPASPTIGQCDEMGFSTEMSSAIIPMMIWFFLDTALHIAMTVMQFMKDRSVGLQRPWYCPIIPILPHDSADDFVGSSIRKITLLVYAGASFILSMTTISMVLGDDTPPKECRNRTGQLSCKELWGCSATSVAYALKVIATSNTSSSYVSDGHPNI